MMENFTSVLDFVNFNSTNESSLWPLDFDPLYQVPNSVVVLLSIFYGTISVLAVVGNCLVMWIVATSRRMQTVTNCFIANLALADIVIGLFAIPFQFQAALLQRWNLPYFMCAFCPFVQYLSVNVSIFTLTAIAVDRHRAILNPLSAQPSKNTAKFIIAAIWMVSGLLAAPMAYALRVMIVEESDAENPRVIHRKPFCLNVHMSNTTMMAYRYVLVFLQYVTPLCIISCVYARMALKLWGSHAPGNAQSSRDANLMKNKKRVIKMLVIVVALFAVCWLPLQTYQVLQDTIPKINDYKYINIIFFVCDWLAMSNSCYNPFIYGIYNEKFKREFRLRFPCRMWKTGNDNFDIDRTYSTHTRASSIRSTQDWRRGYSTKNKSFRANTNHNHQYTRCPKFNTRASYENNSKFTFEYTNVNHINSKDCFSGSSCSSRNSHNYHGISNRSSGYCPGVSGRQPERDFDEEHSVETELFVFPGEELCPERKLRRDLWL